MRARSGPSGDASTSVSASPYMPRTAALLLQGILLVGAGLAIIAVAALGFVQMWQQAASPMLSPAPWWQWVLQAVILVLGVGVVVLGVSGLAHRATIRRARPDPARHAEGRATSLAAVRSARTLTLRIDHSETELTTQGQMLRVSVDAGSVPVPTSLRGEAVDVYVSSPKRDRSQVLLRRRGSEDWCTGIAEPTCDD